MASERTFTINTSLLTGYTSENFKINITPPLLLSRDHEYCAYILKMSMWNSYHNISSTLGNNTLKYIKPDDTEITITLPNGAYNIEAFDYTVKRLMHDNGDYIAGLTGLNDDQYYISFIPNDANGRVRLELIGSYKLDCQVGNLYNYLGCLNDKIYDTSTFFENEAQINNVSSIQLHCNIIRGNSYVNGNRSDVIFSFSPNEAPGYEMIQEPNNLDKISLSEYNEISDIEFYITDQTGKILDLDGEDVNLTLKIEKLKN